MPVAKRLSYREEIATQRTRYSLGKPSEFCNVGYNVDCRLDSGEIKREVLYFSNKNMKTEAVLACMKIHPGCAVREVKYKRD